MNVEEYAVRGASVERTAGAMGDSDELWRWSARQLAHGIATGQVSAREAVESCLGRVDAANQKLTRSWRSHGRRHCGPLRRRIS